MDDLTPWEEIGGRAPAGADRQLTQRSASSLATVTAPVSTIADVVMTLTPCLQLCAPVGMTNDDKDTWFEAAFLALGHIPPDELREAARKAMQTADHPAKIVPAITKAIAWSNIGRYESMPFPIQPPTNYTPPGKPEPSATERANVAQSMGQLLAKLKATAPDVKTILAPPPEPQHKGAK